MKIISVIFVLLAMSVIVEGAWLAAANRMIEPIILSCGAMFVAKEANDKINHDTMHFDWKGPLKRWFTKVLWSTDGDYGFGKTITKEMLELNKTKAKAKERAEDIEKRGIRATKNKIHKED